MIRGSLFLAAILLRPAPSIGADYQPQAKYEPSWESLDARPTPQWFRDAKFGVFICWGLYSVPAWSPKGTYAEWYQYFLQERSQNGQVYDYHVKTYGRNFRYEDFAPLFKAELWNPEEWADLLQNSGAKYIVFTTKHHAGLRPPLEHDGNGTEARYRR
jgi:alpha-L-fucosidase